MTKLPTLPDSDLKDKKVIVRVDLDVPMLKVLSPSNVPEYKVINDSRLKAWYPTIKYLQEQKVEQIVLIGHIGRPLEKGQDKISNFVFISTPGFPRHNDYGPATITGPLELDKDYDSDISLLENIRWHPGEEANDENFTKGLATFGDFYVNEAFATSHRESASIVGLPKLLPHAAGLRFYQEVENLSRVFEDPDRPIIMLISGLKDDKLSYMEDFLKFADKILIGGRLPDYIHDDSPLRKNEKVIVADLLPDKEDITIHTIERFIPEIEKAGTVVVSGPIGKFEEEGHRQGTQKVFAAVASSRAFKVAGGGDTESAIALLNLKDKFNWISVGGGAMLEFLAKKTLPGIEALLS